MKRNKILTLLLLLTALLLFSGCGGCNRFKHKAFDYINLTGKTVRNLKLYNGNAIIATFEEAKIEYTEVDSDSFVFSAKGKKYYYMPGALMEIDD